ncbi:MAG: sigma-70 family RNA polymerase sigma factor [Bacilli bacterium]|nr:sigma-70 family RNA polymerase sigma factor [Bacilli bacterium]
MDKLPKRRKLNDNPYTLLIEDNKYYIIFKDNKNVLHKENVNKEVFDVFDESEKKDNSFLKEFSIHIEHSQLSDINLYKRMKNKVDSIEEQILNNSFKKELKDIINQLPEIQKRRLIKYFFDNKTYEQIAKEEKCSKVAIKYSIDSAIKNFSKKFNI